MDKKIKALTLVLMTVSAAICIGLATSAFAQTNSTTTATGTFSADTSNPCLGAMGIMMDDQGFGGGQGRHGGPDRGFGDYMGKIEVSSAFNQTVTNILGNDSDVTNLTSQGYNVTSIRPIIQSVIGADGTITTIANSAIVTMQNGTSGYTRINVDITNAKVTNIVILTRTVIDKTTS